MNDAPKGRTSHSPFSDKAGFTDTELTAAVRRAIKAAPDPNTQARIDRRVAEALKTADSKPRSNNRTA